MKKRYILAVAILLLLPIMAAADEAIPDVKNATKFTGQVTIDGSLAPDGTSVEAKAGTVLRGRDPIGTKGGTYSLLAGPGTETLTFYVRGISAATYNLGANDKAKTVTLDLSITTTSPGDGGGSSGSTGGGGGGGASGENTANIEFIEKYDMTISKDVLTAYRFTDARNPVRYVNITGNTNAGVITTSVEGLKNTSSLVKTAPGGLVYKNANIWVGTTGFATQKNIKEAIIKFRVTNAWMTSNSVSGSNMVLVKWSGTGWIQLETKEISKDDTNTYFEGKTDSFSPFAITTKTAEAKPTGTAVPTPAGTAVQTPEVTATPQPEAESNILTWIIGLIILVVIAAAAYFFVLKK